jgi:hypothetical protein
LKQIKSYSVKDFVEASHKTANDLSFTSLVDDVEIYPKPKDVDWVESKAKVFWELNMDAREYGIKGIYPTVNKIIITGQYEYEADIGEEQRVEPIEITITRSDWHIKEDYGDAKLADGLYPNLVQINPETKQCVVEF